MGTMIKSIEDADIALAELEKRKAHYEASLSTINKDIETVKKCMENYLKQYE